MPKSATTNAKRTSAKTPSRLPFVPPRGKLAAGAIPVRTVTTAGLDDLFASLPAAQRDWAKAHGFAAKPGTMLCLPGEDGRIALVLLGAAKEESPMAYGRLATRLPGGVYRIEDAGSEPGLSALGLALGAYRFERYRKGSDSQARFVMPQGADSDRVTREADAAYLVRDLINTPTNDLGPKALEAEARAIARRYQASVNVISGEALLKNNLPMIHAVGRAGSEAPRLIDIAWGRKSHPRVTLVGKGVCFDTGGLNIKPGNSMALMKKDMGGAANVLGLGMMIMQAKLPVRLRVLVPAVENAISANAFRPGDILPSRKGITVEIGNTDAEGRLILADALTLGDEEKPDLMIDMATLTGAARVALGPDLPPFYTDDESLAEALAEAASALYDPLWRMPLWKPYESMLSSKIAETNHITSGGFAGSVTAALFLKKFVNAGTPWVHLDIFGWVPTAKPWCPVGGEAQGIRALYRVIADRYAKP